jgi:hypothetical protein
MTCWISLSAGWGLVHKTGPQDTNALVDCKQPCLLKLADNVQ